MKKKQTTYNGYTDSRKEANKKYMDKFVQLKILVPEEKKKEITQHASSLGESTAAFIKRAIDETMNRDN